MSVGLIAVLLIIIGTGFWSGYTSPRYLKDSQKLMLLGIFTAVLFLFGAYAMSRESYFWGPLSFAIFFWFVGVVLGELFVPPPEPEPEPPPKPEPEPDPDPELSLSERMEEWKKRHR